jgi:anti-anti-sigma factor
MIKLTCFACGLSIPYRRSDGDLCPRCLARRHHAVVLVPVSDRPAAVSRSTVGRLRIQRKARDGRLVLVLSGELDISSAPLLEAELLDSCSEGKDVIIDMTGVEFIDSVGLRAILRGQQTCAEHRCGYFLTPPQPRVQHVFELTGVIERLPFEGGPAGSAAGAERRQEGTG